jgi:hypothetical protein
MNNLSLIAIGILLSIIVLIGAKMIFTDKRGTQDTSKTQIEELRDSLAILHHDISESHSRQLKLQSSFDSLQSVDQQVIYRTREKIKFIFNTSDPSILDSLIRSNWRTNF